MALHNLNKQDGPNTLSIERSLRGSEVPMKLLLSPYIVSGGGSQTLAKFKKIFTRLKKFDVNSFN